MQFNTPFTFLAPLSTLILCIAASLYISLRYKKHMQKSKLVTLSTLRIITALLLCLLLTGPFILQSRPDSSAFKTAFLIDASGSMQIKDCEGNSRLETADGFLKGKNDFPISQLVQTRNITPFAFANEMVPAQSGVTAPLPGRTNIAGSLFELLRVETNPPLGAVILASDGNDKNSGRLIEAAKSFRSAGIPVSCIGIGSRQTPGDIRITTSEKNLSGKIGEPTTVPITITNTFNTTYKTKLQLFQGTRLIDEKPIELSPNSETEQTFSITPVTSGSTVYRTRILTPETDTKPETDLAFLAIDVEEPATSKILYLGSKLNWTYKFLKVTVDTEKRLNIEAIIQTAENKYFTTLKGRKFKTFPEEPNFYNEFKVIITDTGSFSLMSEKTLQSISSFVDSRGGGLLLTGPVTELPATIRTLAPALDSTTKRLRTDTFLEVKTGFVFEDTTAPALLSPPGPNLPVNTTVHLPEKQKSGARNELITRNNNDPVLTVQYYGGGRTALLSSDYLWRWKLVGKNKADSFHEFWAKLIEWLAASGKSRISSPLNGERIAVNEQVPLNTYVYAKDYTAAPSATTKARITAPDGSSKTIPMHASLRQPEIFTAAFTPDLPGEYRMQISSEFTDGSTEEEDIYFLAEHVGAELTNTAFHEDILRDVARITGGQYIHWPDAKKLKEPPLAQQVKTIVTEKKLSDSIIYGLILISFFCFEWFYRRRIGLR